MSNAATNNETGCVVWQGGGSSNGYGKVRYQGATWYVHRLAYALHYGGIPEGLIIDHRCRNRRCINPDHLRAATVKGNQENTASTGRKGASGYRGVYFSKRRHKWIAQVTHNYKTTNLGGFDTPEEAARAAREARLALFTLNDQDRDGVPA